MKDRKTYGKSRGLALNAIEFELAELTSTDKGLDYELFLVTRTHAMISLARRAELIDMSEVAGFERRVQEMGQALLKVRSECAPRSDVDRVLAVADEISGERSASLAWFYSPLKEFGNEIPERLVTKGRTEDLLGYLRSISSGSLG